VSWLLPTHGAPQGKAADIVLRILDGRSPRVFRCWGQHDILCSTGASSGAGASTGRLPPGGRAVPGASFWSSTAGMSPPRSPSSLPRPR
jgi:hypothetical protein